MPLFANAPPTQCIATATCIDHPPTIDLSRIAGALPGNPSPASLMNVAIPAHNHVVGTRNNGLPEWWNVEVVATTSPSTFATLTSVQAIDAAKAAGTVAEVPTNAYLFFQVLPGTVPAAQAANLAATAPPSYLSQGGATFDNLKNECSATAPNCQNIGISHDWINGTNVDALYTESYFCDTHVTSGASTGCEAGAPPTTVPPGVSDPTPPSTTVTNSQIDPLYIPVPIYSSPPLAYTQCPTVVTCIDHPATIDLSRLSSALGAPASALTNVPLPSHDHLLTTLNGNQPEWWNVIVIPVTTPQGLASVESLKSYTAVKALEGEAGSGIGGEVPTNAYLWFQTLPGTGPASPGPVQSNCMSHLPSGSVVGGAALNDGTGYILTDSKGDVSVFGAATCYGSLTGVPLNQPIVGITTDKTTGGYWLVAADGGVFAFNAPFDGSAGGLKLNKPVVGMTSTLNGNGYWLVASDGGVFSYGSARFQGSTGNLTLNKPVVGMGLDRATGGYWLVASDGGVFSYNAPFYGSTGNLILNKPVVGGMNNNSYDGYWMVASDGGVFTFSPPGEGMQFFGSAA